MNGKKKKKLKIKYLIFPIIVIAVVAIVLVNMNSKSSNTSTQYDEETAKRGDIVTYYSFSGNIEAKEEKNIVADRMIKIKEFRVKEGDLVNAGDLLYVIDESDSEANLKQAAASVEVAQINLDNAKNGSANQQLIQLESAVSSAKLSLDSAAKNLERTTSLYNEGGVAEQSLEQAKTQYDTAKQQYDTAVKNYNLTKNSQINVSIDTAAAQLKQAQAAYDVVKSSIGVTEVRAEISGEVTKIYPDLNTSIMTGASIMDISDYNSMQAVVKVDEYDVSAVTEGKDVIVRVDALNKEFSGKISKVSKDATKDTLATSLNEISYYSAEIDLENSPELYSGMSVEAKVLNQSVKDAVIISMNALQFDEQNNPYVLYLNEKGETATKSVKVGVNDGIAVQITEGLNEGDVIQAPKKANNPFATMMKAGGE